VSYNTFPTLIGAAWDIKKKTLFSTSIETSSSGAEYRLGRWGNLPHYEFQMKFSYLSQADRDTVEAFVVGQGGSMTPFLLNIPNDNAKTAQALTGVVNGTNKIFVAPIPPQAQINTALPPTACFNDWQGSQLLFSFSRKNWLLQSADWTNASWSKQFVTITANAATAPDGTVTMDKVTEDGTTNGHYINQGLTAQIVGTRYAMSIYAKETGVGSKRYLGIVGTGFAVNQQAVFDLATGTVTFTAGGATAAIIAMSGGGYRCLMYTDVCNITTPAVQYRLTNTSSAAAPSYAGDSTSSLYMWGAQMEPGYFLGPYAGAYIPTTTTAVTVTDFTYDATTFTFNSAPAIGSAPTWTGYYLYLVRFKNDDFEVNQFMGRMYEVASIAFRTVR
jgi:hypothetical protein